MNLPKIISFDAEGTLVTPEFSDTVWHQAIPELYARKHSLSFEQARQFVRQEYDNPGSEQPDRLTVEQVRSATNTWLSAADRCCVFGLGILA